MTQRSTLPSHPVDLVVVGAGVVGLAHAIEAHLRGLSVAVIERDERAVGASVRNFGHVCTTPQSGVALDYAMVARTRWLELAGLAGVPVTESGTLVLARHEDEMTVLEDFAAQRGDDQVHLLGRAQVADHLPSHDETVVGGAHLPLDLRTDPRVAVARMAAWLEEQGVSITWRTSMLAHEPGLVRTSRGDVTAARTVVAVGHDVDRILPDVADEIGLRRCRLAMLEVAVPARWRVDAAVLSGTSMLRYAGLAASPAVARVRERLREESPELLDTGVNLMLTQRPDGTVILGDTHHDALTHDPFVDESLPRLLLAEGARLLGLRDLPVLRRWQGVYATSDQTDFLIAAPDPTTRVVTVASGIGMTTCHGLAADVLDGLL